MFRPRLIGPRFHRRKHRGLIMRSNRAPVVICSALLCGASAVSAAGIPPGYNLQILQPLPGYSRTSAGGLEQQSQGLNDIGQTAGRSFGPTIGQQLQRLATIWDTQGHGTALATPDDAFLSRAYDINNKGEAVGTIQTGADPLNSLRAVHWKTPDSYEFLLPDTGMYTDALRINDNGWIMGFYLNSHEDAITTRVNYVRKADGTRIDIAPVQSGGVDLLFEFNNDNVAFGTEFLPGFNFDTGEGFQRAIRWSEAGGLEYLPGIGDQDIAGFGSAAGIAAATFDSHSGSLQPFRYKPDLSVMTLGQLSQAVGSDGGFSINDSGLQVGITYTCDSFDLSCALATIWDSAGKPFDLNSLVHSDYTLQTAYSINNKGMIFGDAISPAGLRFAYLAAPVPEASTWAMMMVGLAFAGVAQRRRVHTKVASG